MTQYRSYFQTSMTSKDMNTRLENLPLGVHTVALSRFRAIPSERGNGTRTEAEFVIVESDNPKVKAGSKRSWPWFPEKPGDKGAYEKDRLRRFVEAGVESLSFVPTGDLPPTVELCADMEDGKVNGLLWTVEVTPVMTKDAEPKHMKTKKGEEINNGKFYAYPNQSLETCALICDEYKITSASGVKAPSATSAPAEQPAALPQTASAPAAPATSPTGASTPTGAGLNKFFKKG